MIRPHTLVALTLLLIPTARSPAATLLYMGNTISGDSGSGRITASMDIVTQLTPGAVLVNADVASFAISFLGDTVTDATATFSTFELTIGQNGIPTSWGFYAEQNFQGTGAPEQLGSHHGTTELTFGRTEIFSQDTYMIDDPDADSAFGSGSTGSFNSFSQGTWRVIPEPSSVPLVAVSLFYVAGMRRRKSVATTV